MADRWVEDRDELCLPFDHPADTRRIDKSDSPEFEDSPADRREARKVEATDDFDPAADVDRKVAGGKAERRRKRRKVTAPVKDDFERRGFPAYEKKDTDESGA